MNDEKSRDASYAPAAGELARATVIHTPDTGLTAERIRLDINGAHVPVYVARLHSGARLPVVLVLPEAFGLHEHIEDIARRFAKEGYLAIAPDLMFRQGDPKAFNDISVLVRDLLLHIPDEQVMQDLDACIEWAGRNGGDTSRVAATGFCWGGRWVWLYAARRKLACAVAWYGVLDGIASGLFPDNPKLFPSHPIDLTGELQTQVLGLYGANDEAISIESIQQMSRKLASGNASARESHMEVYASVGHAFFADYRESYAADAAQDAWARCLAWFRDHGLK
jgi:carboxymethylenebutenolidase